jgi:hypothetical protein
MPLNFIPTKCLELFCKNLSRYAVPDNSCQFLRFVPHHRLISYHTTEQHKFHDSGGHQACTINLWRTTKEEEEHVNQHTQGPRERGAERRLRML